MRFQRGLPKRASNQQQQHQQQLQEKKQQQQQQQQDLKFPSNAVLGLALELQQVRRDREIEAERERAARYNAASWAIAEKELQRILDDLAEQRFRSQRRRWHREQLREWRAKRAAKKMAGAYTMQEFAAEMEEAIGEVGGRKRLPGEDDWSWYVRLQAVEDESWRVFGEHRGSIRARLKDYVDGFPAKEAWRPFTCVPHFRQEFTGERACLRCFAEGMRCSFTIQQGTLVEMSGRDGRKKKTKIDKNGEKEAACSRCVRNGADCIRAKKSVVDEDILKVKSWNVGKDGEKRRRRKSVVKDILAEKNGIAYGSVGLEERRNWALPRPEPGEWPWEKQRM